jgi:hypothetical protein
MFAAPLTTPAPRWDDVSPTLPPSPRRATSRGQWIVLVVIVAVLCAAGLYLLR